MSSVSGFKVTSLGFVQLSPVISKSFRFHLLVVLNVSRVWVEPSFSPEDHQKEKHKSSDKTLFEHKSVYFSSTTRQSGFSLPHVSLRLIISAVLPLVFLHFIVFL